MNESKNAEVEISVNIPYGAMEIQLKVDDLSDRIGDWSVWAYPLFKK